MYVQPISIRAIDQVIARNAHMPGRVEKLCELRALVEYYRQHGYPKSTVERLDKASTQSIMEEAAG